MRIIINLAIWDLKYSYRGLTTEKRSLFVRGTLRNNSTQAVEFTDCSESWVGLFWELACSPWLGHSMLLILGYDPNQFCGTYLEGSRSYWAIHNTYMKTLHM